jgi:hypothetical protein
MSFGELVAAMIAPSGDETMVPLGDSGQA